MTGMERHVRFWKSLQEEEQKETVNTSGRDSADEVLEKNGINVMLGSDFDEKKEVNHEQLQTQVHFRREQAER